MELWLQIALGFIIGASILLILNSLKDIIILYNISNYNYYVTPQSMLKRVKNSMRSALLGIGFVFVAIILYLFN